MKSITLIFFLIILQFLRAQPGNLSPEEESLIDPSDYTPLDPSEVESNPQIQGLLYLGLQNAIQQAIQDGSLPQATYKVSQILGVAQKLDAIDTQDYKFDVEITDGQDTPVIVFFLSYDPSKGTSEVTSYSVISDDYTDLDPNVIDTNPQISAILNLGVQNVTEEAFQAGTIDSTDYQLEEVNRVEQSKTNPNQYRFDVDLEANSDSDEVRAMFSLVYRRETGSVEILYYTITDAESDSDTENEGEAVEFIEREYEVGEETEDGFVILDPSLADTDPLVRGILFLGAQEAITQAIADGFLSNSTYELAEIHSIEQGIENPDNYKFDVSVRDGSENIVRMDLDLLYESADNGVEVVSFGILSTTENLEKESSAP